MRFGHVLIAILVAAIWGLNFIVVKVGLHEIPPFLYGAGRFIIAALPALFLPRPKISWWIIGGIGLFLGVLKFSLMFMGIHLGVSAGLASLVLQSQAFFTVALSVLYFKSKLMPNHITGMLLALLGVVMIAFQLNEDSTMFGFSLILASAAAWSVSNILYRKAGNVDMFSLTAWTSVIPPIPMLIVAVLYDGADTLVQSIASMTSVGWLCLLYTACASTWIGATLWGVLLRTYEPHRVAPFSLLVPVFGISFANLILGEEFTFMISLACGIIFLGLVINQWHVESDKDISKEDESAPDVAKAA